MRLSVCVIPAGAARDASSTCEAAVAPTAARRDTFLYNPRF
jgi:hypothetical protein